MSTGRLKICRGGRGLVFPAGGQFEEDLHDGVRATLYLIGLAWCFLGVAIVSDVFMGAIETITSKKRQIFDKVTKRHRTVKIWNDTVANLTLMALGSSAPEILLSVIELFKNDFYSGDLGPGTIVGSAAYNLLVISSVCIMSIPSPEVRYIKETSVYVVTATSSIFAYLWLLYMLVGSSPDVVDLWEAVVTFCFFPVLICFAFAADKGLIGTRPPRKQTVLAAEMTKEELAELLREIRNEFGDLDQQTMTALVERRTNSMMSPAHYRVTSSAARAGRVFSSQGAGIVKKAQSLPDRIPPTKYPDMAHNEALLEFESSHHAIREGDGKIAINVVRHGSLSSECVVAYRTRDGTAVAKSDYVPVHGRLHFKPFERVRQLCVEIIDDTQWESAEDFYVDLSEPSLVNDTPKSQPVQLKLGPIMTTMVTIIDDDDPGAIAFESEFVSLDEQIHDFVHTVKLHRRHGSRGNVSCSYKTQDGSAVSPLDYEAVDGEIEFRDGQLEAEIHINIKARGRYDNTERFCLILFNAVGCRFDDTTDGGSDQNICWIEIKASLEYRDSVEAISKALALNWDKARIGRSNWKEQFSSALFVGGSREEHAEAGFFDWAFHMVALPWKLAFALIPPCDFADGWACFFGALIGIGILTALVGDLASLLGCVAGIPDAITAITLVALGTSLPDTFASMSAAQQDLYADASIGNVTGSNSVNVFLGLGIAWTIGAVYWKSVGATDDWKQRYPDFEDKLPRGGFVMRAKGLDFSVALFCTNAMVCILVLFIRRKLFGGELGGPKVPKIASAVLLVLLWCGYIGASWVYIEITK